jgi:hypothetical protein
LFRAREQAAVAELGPHRHGDEPADAVLSLDQRLAGRLLGAEALQVLRQRQRLGVGRVDHPIPGPDPLLRCR